MAGGLEKRPGLFVCGRKMGLLEELVVDYKYQPIRGLGRVLAEVMDEVIPCLGRVVVVPLPTVSKHIRERGFDHMELMARRLAEKRGWECVKALKRANSTVQVGMGKAEREQQAKTAYKAKKGLDSEATYLLVDDVWTTGASMRAAEEEMRRCGAKKIYKAVVVVSEK